jgi:hypothetical protein
MGPLPPPTFEMVLNDISSIESAVALYGTTRDESLKLTIQHYYRNGVCGGPNVSKNLCQFLAAAKEHPELMEICLQQVNHDDLCPTMARDLEPEVLLQVLQQPTHPLSHPLSGSHASLLVAACCTSAETCMSLDVFRQLTSSSILPCVDPMAAVFLLACECDYGSIRNSPSSSSTISTSLRSRCISAIRQDWKEHVEAMIAVDMELSQAWDKIPPEVQASCTGTMLQPQPHPPQDQDGFDSLPCAQSLVVEDDSDDDDEDSSEDDDSIDPFQEQQQPPYYARPKCIPSEIPLKVVPRNGRLGASDELFQGYCLYNSTDHDDNDEVVTPTTTTTALDPPMSPSSLLRSLWENIKLRTSHTNLVLLEQEEDHPDERMILYTTRHVESASSA